MSKPSGPKCNLGCRYCFYLEKEISVYPEVREFRMSEEILEEYIRQYIGAQDAPEINFAWQGGEPTMLGLEFFARAVELQKKYCPPGKKISNAFQTNGTLLDSPWCKFLKENRFLVGLSIDGPRELHDSYRVDRGGGPTFDKVMRGLELLKRHRVEFNTLTVVNRLNSQHPEEVYGFLRQNGSGFMQFIPLVEREGQGRALAAPAALDGSSPESPVAEWSVKPEAYGDFLVGLFDSWVRRDVGRYFVQLFDATLAAWLGMPPALCVYSETCGKALALEHNGDLFSCDHYVYPTHRLGNILDEPMEKLVETPLQVNFGREKRDKLPNQCRTCEYKFACNGECPKHRFVRSRDGEPGLSYLCPGLMKYYRYVDPYMRAMADLLRRGQPASAVMSRAVGKEAGLT